MSKNKVRKVAESLIVLRLSMARRLADMQVFDFGDIREENGRTVGQYALHVQCPWPIDRPEGIVTGRSDLWEHISGKTMTDEWEPGTDDNIQDVRISNLFGGYDAKTHSHLNSSEWLVVERVQASDIGDLNVSLSGGYRLVLFPDGSIGEAWRIFEPGRGVPHFVIEDGRGYFV